MIENNFKTLPYFQSYLSKLRKRLKAQNIHFEIDIKKKNTTYTN